VQDAFEAARKLVLMTVFRNEDRWDTSNIEYHDGRIVAYDKTTRTAGMKHIDYGLGVWNHRAFEGVPQASSCDLAAVCQKMLLRGELAGFEVTERFYEIGSFTGLAETRKHLAGRF